MIDDPELDRVVLQPADVYVRHIKLGASTDPGAVQVLDTYLVPQPVEAINGRSGWTSASYDRRRGEPGTFRLTLPNGAGQDGTLHRRRFGILTKRRGQVPDDLVYRAGDEWLEFWRTQPGSPFLLGDLLYVGTPTRAENDGGELVLSGFDALWLQNLQRETSTGFHVAAPRDVFEHYSRTWTDVIADDFPTPAAPRFTYGTTAVVEALGKWATVRAEESPRPGCVRLRPTDTNNASIYSQKAGTQECDWRLEMTFYREAFVNGTQALYLGVVDALPGPRAQVGTGPPDYTRAIEVNSTSLVCRSLRSAAVGTRTYYSKTVGVNPDPGGPYTVAIERRDRWIYFFYNDELVCVLPRGHSGFSDAAPRPIVELKTTAGVTAIADIEDIRFKRTSYFLMRASAVPMGYQRFNFTDIVPAGDLRLPGTNLVAGGLVAAFYSERDTPAGELERALDPLTETFGRRQDSHLAQVGPAETGAPTWQSPTCPIADGFSARWVGAVYLDFDAHGDYAIRATADDRARIWIGRTRHGEETVADWTDAGHPYNTTTGAWLKAGGSAAAAPAGAIGVLAGARSGWYPIIVEYGQNTGAGAGGVVVQYQRADQLGLWRNIGQRDYGHRLRAVAGLLVYYPLGMQNAPAATPQTTGTVEDHSGNGKHGDGVAALSRASPGASLGDLATDFSGAAGVFAQTPTTGLDVTTALSVEAWVQTDSIAAGFANIIRRDHAAPVRQWGLRRSGASLTFFVVSDTGTTDVATGNILVVGAWTHVLATWDGANSRIYINGVLAAGPTARTGTLAALVGDKAAIGAQLTNVDLWDGRIQDLTVYNRALAAQEAADHVAWKGLSTQDVKLAPTGVFEDLVRNDSFAAQLDALYQTFGIEYTLEPQSLESGLFPGQLTPVARLGRDTALVLGDAAGVEPSLAVDVEDSCDTLLLDAAGLADPTSGGQVTKEAVNWAAIDAPHLVTATAYDSLSDITIPALAEQRAAALMALRAAPWEDVGIRPDGRRRQADTWPLTGAAAEFAWSVGDGVRIARPELDIDDDDPRRLTIVTWPLYPKGIGRPAVGWAQRTRTDRDFIRGILRRTLNADRNYQGQIVTVSGNHAANPTYAQVPDNVARVALPTDISRVISATLVVDSSAATVAHNVTVNGVGTVLFTVLGTGRYDLTPYVARPGSDGRMYVTLAGGTGAIEWTIELDVIR